MMMAASVSSSASSITKEAKLKIVRRHQDEGQTAVTLVSSSASVNRLEEPLIDSLTHI